jgi:putative SOS response-associated peptidase YedK
VRRCYNARTETVATKPSFRDAWRRGQRCIIPADVFFEPNYESGKAVRWAVRRADDSPILIGGIWSEWIDRATGEVRPSFTMLTVNVDSHPLLRRLHAPDDEKRGLVMVAPDDVERWLSAPIESAAVLARPHDAALLRAEPAPLPVRRRSVSH